LALKKLSIADLAALDSGRVAAAFDAQLAAAIADCSDRPEVETARKIKLEISLTPIMDSRRDLGEVVVGFEIQGKSPALKSREYTMDHRSERDRTTGRTQMHLVFNEDAHGDPHNQSLPLDGENDRDP